MSAFLVCLAIIFAPSSPARANGMTTEVPSPEIYQIEEFLFTGLSIFNGSTYVENSWYKVKVAIPKKVQCDQFDQKRADLDLYNCKAPIRTSGESSVSIDPKSTFNGSVLLTAYIDGTLRGTPRGISYPTVPLGRAMGSYWANSDIRFSLNASGMVSLRVDLGAIKPTVNRAIQIQVNVKTQADIEAENQAARAAAIAAAERIKAATEVAEARDRATQLAKKLTITCVKGKISKKVTGDSPRCPKGYKNPMEGFATFKAFSTCQLYKKDALVGGARLMDGGRTLILDTVKERSYRADALVDSDYECAAGVMKMPAFISSKIESTRAIDGMQTAQWGKLSAFWNYHPDNGLNITFNFR